MNDARTLVFFGATGTTGRCAVRAAARRGLRFAIAGRNRRKLDAIAGALSPRPEVIVADALDSASMRAMARRATTICSTAGPFTTLGAEVVRACLDAGANYLDASGEQGWVARCLDDFDAPARRAGIVIAPSMAYEVAVADCAGAVAIREMGEAAEVRVVYVLHGFGTTRGTRLSVIETITQGSCQWVDDHRHLESPASDVHRVVLPPPEGPRALLSFGSPEAITLPHHARAHTVRAYLGVSDRLGPAVAWVGPKLPSLLRGRIGRAARRIVVRLPERRRTLRRMTKARSTILAVARSRTGRARTVTVRLIDPYGLSGEILVSGAQALASRNVEVGFRAPTEVLGDPAAFLQTLSAYGAQMDMVEADLLTGG